MKKLMLLTTLLMSLGIILLVGCSESKKELYEKTDTFVQELQTTYEHYDMLGKHATSTSDGLYQITPLGRLINVKIQKVVDDSEYEALRKDLEKHYKGDTRVKDVYICNGGTVMIDCRN